MNDDQRFDAHCVWQRGLGQIWVGAVAADPRSIQWMPGPEHFDEVIVCCPLGELEAKYTEALVPHIALCPFADDVQPPTPRELFQVSRAVAIAVTMGKSGRSVAVLCREGRNRSALVAALAVKELDGVSGEDAIREIRRKRILETPGPYQERPIALTNHHFVEIVKDGIDYAKGCEHWLKPTWTTVGSRQERNAELVRRGTHEPLKHIYAEDDMPRLLREYLAWAIERDSTTTISGFLQYLLWTAEERCAQCGQASEKPLCERHKGIATTMFG